MGAQLYPSSIIGGTSQFSCVNYGFGAEKSEGLPVDQEVAVLFGQQVEG